MWTKCCERNKTQSWKWASLFLHRLLEGKMFAHRSKSLQMSTQLSFRLLKNSFLTRHLSDIKRRWKLFAVSPKNRDPLTCRSYWRIRLSWRIGWKKAKKTGARIKSKDSKRLKKWSTSRIAKSTSTNRCLTQPSRQLNSKSKTGLMSSKRTSKNLVFSKVSAWKRLSRGRKKKKESHLARFRTFLTLQRWTRLKKRRKTVTLLAKKEIVEGERWSLINKTHRQSLTKNHGKPLFSLS